MELEFMYGDKKITVEEIRKKEAERAGAALQTIAECGMKLSFKGKEICLEDALQLKNSDRVRCCNETKRTLTMPVILKYMKPVLERSDSIWRDIAARGHYKTDFKKCFVDVHVTGIPMKKMAKAVPKAFHATNEDLAYTLHPEHYVFSKKGMNQFVLENLGTYTPVYSRLKTAVATKHIGYKPVAFDPDTKFAGRCEFFLMSDNTNMKTFAMHQIRPAKDGLNIRLGLFFPDSAPEEMIEGHKWHFCVEFYNAFMLLNMLVNGVDASNKKWCYERLLTKQSFR